MGGEQYSYSEGDKAWFATFLARCERQSKGYIGLSLTNFITSTVCAIAEGSVLEINGAVFIFSSDTSISGAIATGLNYIVCSVTGTTAEAYWTSTVGSYDIAKQGFYTGSERYVGECYYDGASYESKQEYNGANKTRGDGIPEGIIVARISGYFGDGANDSYIAVSIPLTSKWKACDGAALNDPLSIIFNGAGRYLPNLTDDRFLQGNALANVGDIGGSNTIANHKHQTGHLTGASTKHLYMYNSGGSNIQINSFEGLASNAHGGMLFYQTSDITLYSKTDGGGGDNRPKYLSCQYIMKVRA